MPDSAADLAHLYRRLAFGARPAELSAALARGYDASVTALLATQANDPADTIAPPALDAPPTTTLTPDQRKVVDAARRTQTAALVTWWIDRMCATTNPAREKFVWFWHSHFATSIEKVDWPLLMFNQNQIFRRLGFATFEPLVQAVAKDPAMMVWLDTARGDKTHPNENFARELMELFTLGIGTYTETDVREAARCFTGWRLDAAKGFVYDPKRHDTGTKTVLGTSGNLGGEDVCRLVSTRPATATFLTARLWSRYAAPTAPAAPVVGALAPALAADATPWAQLGRIARHAEFRSPATRAGLVRQPVEWLVAALRAFGLRAGAVPVADMVRGLNQVPFAPPSVGSWPPNGYWLSTTSAYVRLRHAATIATAAQSSTAYAAFAGASAAARPQKLADTLGIAPAWGAGTAAAIALADNPHDQLTIALCAPEFVCC